METGKPIPNYLVIKRHDSKVSEGFDNFINERWKI